MARIRRAAVLVSVAALAGAVVTGPAQADSPEVFSGSAAGSALDLSVLGKQATFGVSAARANSTGAAKARGISQASTTVPTIDSVLGANSSDVVADVKAGEGAVSNERQCHTPDLPISDFLTIGLACADADASSAPTSAAAEGSVAELDLHVETVIEALEETAETDTAVIGDTLATVLDSVCGEVGEACPATTTVKDLVQSVLKTQTLEVDLGKSTSSVQVGEGSVTSNATASGAVIKILPLPQVNGLPATEPVVTITVGDAKATATYDRKTGKATPSVDPAIVRIEFNQSLNDTLGIDDIVITPQDILDLGVGLNETLAGLPEEAGLVIEVCDDGRAICILPGTDLESRIYLATGSAKVNEDGSATAVADAVRLDLLMGLTERLAGVGNTTVVGDPSAPGLHLALAHAEAAVGGKPLQITSTPTTTPGGGNGGPPPLELNRGDFPTTLARTGGLPVVPFLGMAFLGLAVVFRRATAQATR